MSQGMLFTWSLVQCRRPAALFTVVLAAVLTCPPAGFADTRLGLVHFERGEFAEAYQEWRNDADAGGATGALFIGVLYDTGEGVPYDESQALAWYRRAADAGSAPGAFNVGAMYDAGRGTPRNTADAAKWFEIAAQRGYGRGAYALGLMYEAGDGVPRDPVRAASFFRQAAARGLSAANLHLAKLEPGRGSRLPAPSTHAEDPAMHDFSQAQDILLARGPREATEAIKLLRRAADQNNATAEYDLAYCYEHGLGLPGDDSQAEALYGRAATHATDDFVRSLAVDAMRKLRSRVATKAAGDLPR